MFIDPAAGDCWHRDFPGTTDQVRVVRAFTAALLADCPFLDEVLLGVDELAANTIRHTRSGELGGRFTVELRRWHGPYDEHGKDTELVAVSVRDQGGPREPVADIRDPDDEDFWLAESGRGLWTVSRTAVRWGWFGNAAGRTVCAVFAAPALLPVAA
ncbi:MAG: ATP-binding protein [Streptosporangiaceae bacterium]